MALVRCSECSREVSDRAASCPGCGAPVTSGVKPVDPRKSPIVAPVAPRQEETIYSRNGVIITTTRVVFPTRTYSTANITSVAARASIVPAPKLGPIILIAIGFLVGAVGGITALNSLQGILGPEPKYSELQAAVAIGLVGLALIVAGFVAIHRLKDGALHHVFVGSASGEAEALASPDREFIHGVAEAINSAIVKRG